MRPRLWKTGRMLALCALLLAGWGGICHADRYDYRMVLQPKYKPEDQSRFFADGSSARPLVPGTIPIDGHPNGIPIEAVHSERYAGKDFPFKLTGQGLKRGRVIFNIYCSVCHGQLGDGMGMIPRRGFVQPPSFYLPRLRQAPPGHFYDVITNGYGAMFSYNDRVSSADRWRVVGYIRALQLSAPNKTGPPAPEPEQKP